VHSREVPVEDEHVVGIECDLRSGVESVIVLLSVENDGPGLTPEAVSKLAQPFRRLGAERTSTQTG
jgi:signal transduction histidine kinase